METSAPEGATKQRSEQRTEDDVTHIIGEARTTGGAMFSQRQPDEACVIYEKGCAALRTAAASTAVPFTGVAAVLAEDPIPLLLNIGACVASVVSQRVPHSPSTPSLRGASLVGSAALTSLLTRVERAVDGVRRAAVALEAIAGLSKRPRLARNGSGGMELGASVEEEADNSADAKMVSLLVPVDAAAKCAFRLGQLHHAECLLRWDLWRHRFFEAGSTAPSIVETQLTASAVATTAARALEALRRSEFLGGAAVSESAAFQALRRDFVWGADTVAEVHPRLDVASAGCAHGLGVRVARANPASNVSCGEAPLQIAAGTVLLCERPTVLVFPDAPATSEGDAYTQRFIAAVDRLLAMRKECVSAASGSSFAFFRAMGLTQGAFATTDWEGSDAENSDSEGEQDVAKSADVPDTDKKTAAAKDTDVLCHVWRSNSMLLTNSRTDFRMTDDDEASDRDGETARAAGLYVAASRFNHSCCPNAFCVFEQVGSSSRDSSEQREGGGVLCVLALRDIEPGEEVTISYTDITATASEKRRHLQFTCRCSFCLGPRGAALSLIRCPICAGAVEAQVAAPSMATAIATTGTRRRRNAEAWVCTGCGARLSVRHCLDTIHSKIAECALWCNGNEDVSAQGGDNYNKTCASSGRLRAVQTLLSMERSAVFLGEGHALRFRLWTETLAAAVGAPLTTTLAASLLATNRRALAFAEATLPENWPARVGLMVHLVFSLRRCSAGRLHATQSNGESEDTDAFSTEREEMRDLLCDSFARFFALRGSLVARRARVVVGAADDVEPLREFLRRYRAELGVVGLRTVEDVELFIA